MATVPGPITNDVNREDFAQLGKVEHLQGRIPVGRICDPAGIGDVVKLLVRDEARHINGAEPVLDGELLVNLQ